MNNSTEAQNQAFFICLVRAISVAFQRKVWRVIWQQQNVNYLSIDYDCCKFDELMFKLRQFYGENLWQTYSESVKQESNTFLTTLECGAKIFGHLLSIEYPNEKITSDFFGYPINGPEIYSNTEHTFTGINQIIKPSTFWPKLLLSMNFNPFTNEETGEYTEEYIEE